MIVLHDFYFVSIVERRQLVANNFVQVEDNRQRSETFQVNAVHELSSGRDLKFFRVVLVQKDFGQKGGEAFEEG